MRATILPMAIILTKTCWVLVSMMAKRCIVALILPLKCSLFRSSNFIHVYANIIR